MAQTKANAADYLGLLFLTGKRPNALLRQLGGLTGGMLRTTSRTFPTGTFYSLTAPSQPARLEGANAPTAITTAVTQAVNAVQIFHESIDVTYLAEGEHAVSGVVPIPQGAAQRTPANPRTPEFQVARALEKVAQDLNYSILQGVYSNPADPAANALATRGLLTCVTTNAVDKSAEAAPDAETYKSWVEELVRTIVIATGYQVDNTWTLFVDATQFNNCQAAYEGYTQAPISVTVAGLQILTLRTRMGLLNLVLEPDMTANKLLVANLGVCALVGMEVPSKGILFEEPLDKTGSSSKTQIYGQMGIDHGPEWHHGTLDVPAVTLA
ncbi:MAG TPA: hypothetical protein DCQ64_24125 [Candidatus Rokubacteria bacterium]|nr:hypothetical protein [Candidatus Rokubacteria bacterium]